MKLKHIFPAILLGLGLDLCAQNQGSADSMAATVQAYFQNGKTAADSARVQKLEASVQDIGKQNEALSTALAETEGSVQALENARRTEQEAKYRRRLRKICQTPEFVKAANVSLSALTLSNTLTDYLNDVGSLNNPENEELGLSLSATVTKIIDEKIFHGKPKVGKQQKSRFLSVVGTIVNSPLVSGLAGAIPVVSSLGAVTDLVSSLVVNNDDVSMEDYEAYKKEIAGYVAFYEALGHAGNQFDAKVNNLGLRITVLENLLRNFTLERVQSLYPDFASTGDKQLAINELLRSQMDREAISSMINEMEKSMISGKNGQTDFGRLLDDPRLAFPDFAVNQARFIADELQTLSGEYIAAFKNYQADIEKVLAGAPNIVAPEKAEKKSASLRTKLEQLEKAFNAAVNVEDVQARFQKLAGVGA